MPARVRVEVTTEDKSSGALKGIIRNYTDLRNIVMDVGRAAKDLYDFARAGADLERMGRAGGEVFRQMGGDIEEATAAIERASLGTISHYDAMASASRAALLGVSADSEQLGSLMEIAAFRARAMGISTTQAFDDITRGIGRNSPLILDNLGIITKGWANEAEAAGEAFDAHFILNKVLEDGNQMLEKAGGFAEDSATQYERLEVSFKNLTDSMKVAASEGFGEDFAKQANIATLGWTEFVNYLASMGEIRDIQKQMRGVDMSRGVQKDLTSYYEDARRVWAAQKDVASSAREMHDGWMTATEAGGEISTVMEDMTIDYDNLISSIQDIQSETDRYNEKNEELLLKRRELTAQLAEETAQYGAGSQQVADTQSKLDALGRELDQNAKQHQMWAKQTVFALAQARAAADGTINELEGEMLITLGEGLGILGEDSVEMARTMNAAFSDIDFSDPEAALMNFQKMINALTGKTVEVDVIFGYPNGIPDYIDPGSVSVTTGYDDPYCFIAGTRVTMADGTTKPIENINPGDKILSYDTKENKYLTVGVHKTYDHPAEGREYYLSIDDMGVTHEHLIYTVNFDKWIPAGDLRVGDELLDDDGGTKVIHKIEKINNKVRTYNLHTDHPTHNYFANSVLVHNGKQQGGPVYAGMPTRVGEGGSEWFMPGRNGRILGHAESLHAMTLAGAGMGGANYFYGPVTISPGSDAGGDILDVR